MSAKVIPFRAGSAPAGEPEAELSDEALVVACAKKDAAALGALYRRHHPAVYRFLCRLVGARNPELDDLAQAVFLAAWSSAGSYRSDASPLSWLFGIAANVARHHHRSERRRRGAFAWLAERVRGSEPPHDDAVARAQLVDRLSRALEDLPHDLRVAYVMCELEEMPGVEAARVLGVRPGTLWRRLHDARKRLRAALERGGGTER